MTNTVHVGSQFMSLDKRDRAARIVRVIELDERNTIPLARVETVEHWNENLHGHHRWMRVDALAKDTRWEKVSRD